MMTFLSSPWPRRAQQPNSPSERHGRHSGTTARRFVPALAPLESRRLLSRLTVTNNGDSGAGSLRAEIAAASPGDVVAFGSNLLGQTIALASPLQVNTSLTIQGFTFGGPTISGSGSTEVFVIPAGVSVNLTGLQIANGRAANGGAIDNAGNLTIRSSILSNNRAVGNASTESISFVGWRSSSC